MIKDLLTVQEVAEALHVSPPRVYKLMAEGRLPSRFATSEEARQLWASGRIGSIPVQGVRVIARSDLATLRIGKVGRPTTTGTGMTHVNRRPKVIEPNR